MAAISTTGAGAGNWSNTAVWAGGVVPGNGDTVTITRAVTVDVNTTVGASNGIWVSGGNPAAIQLGTGGTLTVAANVKLTCRGDLYANTGFANIVWGLTLNAGSIFEFDSSLTTPTTTSYRFFNNTGGFVYGLSLLANGTQANPCFFQSNAGGANGYIGGSGSAGTITATWLTFLRMGTSTLPPWYYSFNAATGKVNVSLTNVTFDTCGQIQFGAAMSSFGAAVYSFTNVKFINSLGTSNMSGFSYGTFTNCLFDAPGAQSGVLTIGAIWNTCYFHQSAPTPNAKYTTFNNIFFRQVITTLWVCQGDVTGALWVYDNNVTNPAYLQNCIGTSHTWSDIIFDCTHNDGNGDCLHFSNNPSSAGTTYVVRRCIILPNAGGDDSGTGLTLQFTSANGTIDEQHVTCFVGTQGFHYGETSNSPAGTLTAFKNNIGWSSAAMAFNALAGLLQDLGHIGAQNPGFGNPTTDIFAPGNGDFNCTYQVQQTYTTHGNSWFTNQGRGYQGAFTVTPGAHDKTNVNPQFVDTTRNTALFDSAYLGNVAGSTWASHAPTDNFTIGQIVSNNNPIYYSGAVINFRCIQAHTQGTSGSEPGGSFSSAWRTYWELATYQDIRDSVARGCSGLPITYSNATFGLSNVDLIQIARAWIRAGFAPQNTSLRAAGHDGSDIGAVPCVGAYQHNQAMMGCA